MDAQTQQLLDAKDTTIKLLEVKIGLLEELAETRRVNLMLQNLELADLRRYHHVNTHRWGFLMFMLVGDVWPFKFIWRKP